MKALLQNRKKSAFTLAELAVVVIVIGIIAAIIIPRFTGSGASKTRAQALMTFADSGSTIVRSAISQLGIGFNIEGADATASNPIRSDLNWLDVLVYGPFADADGSGDRDAGGGEDIIKQNYQGRYTLTGAGTLEAALSEIETEVDTATPASGVYRVQDYPVELYDSVSGAAATITAAAGPCVSTTLRPRTAYFVYRDVPVDVVSALMIGYEDPEFDPSILAETEADATHGAKTVDYGVGADAADSLYDVCIIKSLK